MSLHRTDTLERDADAFGLRVEQGTVESAGVPRKANFLGAVLLSLRTCLVRFGRCFQPTVRRDSHGALASPKDFEPCRRRRRKHQTEMGAWKCRRPRLDVARPGHGLILCRAPPRRAPRHGAPGYCCHRGARRRAPRGRFGGGSYDRTTKRSRSNHRPGWTLLGID